MTSFARVGEAPPPHAVIMQMVTGYFVSDAVGAVASFGIPDLIASGKVWMAS